MKNLIKTGFGIKKRHFMRSFLLRNPPQVNRPCITKVINLENWYSDDNVYFETGWEEAELRDAGLEKVLEDYYENQSFRVGVVNELCGIPIKNYRTGCSAKAVR